MPDTSPPPRLEDTQKAAEVFAARFSRCRNLLHLIACRVLGGPERADEAIANCLLTGSHNPPVFGFEGAFRSWLLRVLIDEALIIRRRLAERSKAETDSRCEVKPHTTQIGQTAFGKRV